MVELRVIQDGEKPPRPALLGTAPQEMKITSDKATKPTAPAFTVRPPHAEHHLQQQRRAAQRQTPGQSSIVAHAEQRARTRMRQNKQAILSISQPSEITHVYPVSYAEHRPMGAKNQYSVPSISETRAPRSAPLLASPHTQSRSRCDYAYAGNEPCVPNYATAFHHGALGRQFSDIHPSVIHQSPIPQLPNHRTRAQSLPRNAPSHHFDNGLMPIPTTPTPISRVASPILKLTQNGTSHGMMAYSRHYEALEREMQLENEDTIERSRTSKERRDLELEQKVRNIAARRLSSEAKHSQFESFQTIQTEIQRQQQQQEQQQYDQYQNQQCPKMLSNSLPVANTKQPDSMSVPEPNKSVSPVLKHRTGGAIPIIDPATGDRLRHTQATFNTQSVEYYSDSKVAAPVDPPKYEFDFTKGAAESTEKRWSPGMSHLRRGVPTRLHASVKKKSRVLSNGMCVQQLQDLIDSHPSSLSCDAKIFDQNSSEHVVNSSAKLESIIRNTDHDNIAEDTQPSTSLVSQGVAPLCQSFESLSVSGRIGIAPNTSEEFRVHSEVQFKAQTEVDSTPPTPSVLGAYKRFSLASISPSCEALVGGRDVDNAINVVAHSSGTSLTPEATGLCNDVVDTLSMPNVDLDSNDMGRNSSVDSFSAFQTMLEGIKEASTTALAFPAVDQYNSCDTLSLLFAMDGASSEQDDPVHISTGRSQVSGEHADEDISANSSDDEEGSTDMAGNLHNLLKSAAHLNFVNSLTDSEDDNVEEDAKTMNSTLKKTRPRSVSTRDFYNPQPHTSPSPSPSPGRPNLYNAIFSTASPLHTVRKSRFDTMGGYSAFETYGDTKAFVFPPPSH
ncbi:hypothetical protein SARC_06174 [Sphaeroforma arctica JP610]|uniref:Uncharacterized protein n=1 Tax=Sphaeroforma arctica JP610 TaxID=667725 RepID=A0A0L0FZW2_9EUKA|nr:hypothetical protein SARC_06174 [Sphaeroforma arctica JP610]KNC81508.1 hypothetical protein SARC_06174 [Sphaeroforma arctica JP610]|eukprot:XP_014155410.1 hypothetical protein SARC_06174 [Sphaeroforma arctica JP610]